MATDPVLTGEKVRITIDEQMIKYEGTFCDQQYVGNKPNPYGILVRTAVVLGWGFQLTCFIHGRNNLCKKTTMEKVFEKLLSPACDLPRQYRILGRQIFLCSDNLYSCRKSLQFCKEHNIQYVATMRLGRIKNIVPQVEEQMPINAVRTLEVPEIGMISVKQLENNKKLIVVGVGLDFGQMSLAEANFSARGRMYVDSRLIISYKKNFKGVDIVDQYLSYLRPKCRMNSQTACVVHYWIHTALYNTFMFAKHAYSYNYKIQQFAEELFVFMMNKILRKYTPHTFPMTAQPGQQVLPKHRRVYLIDIYPHLFASKSKDRVSCEYSGCHNVTSTICACGFECCTSCQPRHVKSSNKKSIRKDSRTPSEAPSPQR